MKTLRFLLAAMLVLASALPVAAQTSGYASGFMHRHELSFNAGHFGVGCINYHDTRYQWQNNPGPQTAVGLGYTYWFNEHVGINTGFNLAYMIHEELLENVSSEIEGTVYLNTGEYVVPVFSHFSIVTPQVREHQAFFMLEVPVKLALQAKHLYGNVGFVLASPITTFGRYKYDASAYTITSFSGVGVDRIDYPVKADITEAVADSYHPADIKFPFFFVLSADMGWKFYFDRKNALSIGAYVNYAINSCYVDDSNFEIMDISTGTAVNKAPLQTNLVERYDYFNAGIRVAYHFGVGCLPALRQVKVL